MARKKDKAGNKPPAAIKLRVRKHIESLELPKLDYVTPLDTYFSWCNDHGFRASTDKSQKELDQEVAALRRDRERSKQERKAQRSPRKFLEQICTGARNLGEINNPTWREICGSIQHSKKDKASRQSLLDLLLTVYDKADFLTESITFGGQPFLYVDALIKLNDRRGQWIRPLGDWQVTTHNSRRQFSSLVQHLAAEYPVPPFMESAWFRHDRGSHTLREWYVHVGMGKNIRTAKTPVPLTKKMAHHFAAAPRHYSIENAIRWGQVHALGGGRRLTEALLGTVIGNTFKHDEFWLSVIRFFVANPLLDRRHVGPIIDYLNNQKFVTREVVAGPGRVEIIDPPQPGLTMSRRTVDTLLRQVDDWHRELGRSARAARHYFKSSGIKPFERATGRKKEKVWKVRELLSGADLIAEGKKMRHCVASYADSCARG